MKVEELNTDIIGKYARGSDYKVYFFVYLSKNEEKLERLKSTKQHIGFTNIASSRSACFSGLPDMLYNRANKLNRLNYVSDYEYPLSLPREERRDWVKLCKKYNMLPAYTSITSADDKVLVIKLTELLSPSLLYCYLSSFRCLFENCDFVKALLYLVNVAKLNFYCAWELASVTNVHPGSNIHHIGEVTKRYPSTAELDTKALKLITVPFLHILRLCKYFSAPEKYDKRSIFRAKKYLWNCTDTITSALTEKQIDETKKLRVPMDVLLSKKFNDLLNKGPSNFVNEATEVYLINKVKKLILENGK